MTQPSVPSSPSVLRLVAAWGDRRLRWALETGEYVLGSAEACDLRLQHPSVSRRHAAIRVTGGEVDGARVEVEDLGSSNGTRVDDRRLSGPVPLKVGQGIRFGTVEAVLETVAAGDLETAVALGGGGGEAGSLEGRDPRASTISASWADTFVFEHLPELVAGAAQAPPLDRLARQVGAALFAGLPCAGVEIRDVAPPSKEDGIVFTAGKIPGEDGSAVLRRRSAGREIVLVLERPGLGEIYGRLLDLATPLLRLASDPEPGKVQRRPAPALPEPPTLVPEVRSIYRQAARVAPGEIGVLILGESGTGKELLARYLHEASGRDPWIELNCAALPEDLLEAELFGVEKGAATGVEARPGKLELAHGGTLFLDEIGDMAPATQSKILRALQEREVYRLGGHRPRAARARIVAATNRPLEEMLEAGAFRRDLYHRIADWEVELPPLRHRPADVPNLAGHFLERACRERGIRCRGLSRAAVEGLSSFHWPGNVRQLEREMRRAAWFLQQDELLETRHLRPEILDSPEALGGDDLKSRVERFEGREIRKTLQACDGDVNRAAARLGLGRSSLYRRLQKLGLKAK